MRSLSLAQGLLIFPLEATALGEGERVTVQVLDEGFRARVDAGF